jgi:hypothetical protein
MNPSWHQVVVQYLHGVSRIKLIKPQLALYRLVVMQSYAPEYQFIMQGAWRQLGSNTESTNWRSVVFKHHTYTVHDMMATWQVTMHLQLQA